MLAQLSEIFAPTTPQTPPLLTTNREVPRVPAAVPETDTSPRVITATPRVPKPSNPAPAPRVRTTPIIAIPKALTSYLREGSYWQPSQRRRNGQTQPTTAGYTRAIDHIIQQEITKNQYA
jgi:hypothetical protein